MGTLVVTSKEGRSEGTDTIGIYFAIAAYVVAVAPYVAHGHTALGLLCLVLSLWRLHITYVKAILPSSDTTTIVSVLAIVVLAGFTELRLNPQSGAIALMVLVGCKNLAAKTPEQFTNNLLLLPFFPMGLFLTVDPPWATGYLFAFFWVWLSALLRVWQRTGALRATLGKGLTILGLLTPLILLSYFLLPRPHAWWNQQEQQASTGMSATLKPGDVGRLSQNQETAFIGNFPQGLPMDPSTMYWRGLTLSMYRDGEWSAGPNMGGMPREWEEKNTASGTGVPYQILFPNKRDDYLYSLEYSTLAKGNMRWDNTAVIGQGTNRQLFSNYNGTYYPQATMNVAPVRSEMTPLQNDNPKATQLAKTLWAQGPTAEKFLLRLRDHIQQGGFVYSLEPGEMKQSWIDIFLERKKGFCEHYAGAVAYMLRQAGVPTRVVVGFQGAKPYTNDSNLEIPYSAAHAWMEYWSEPGRKWVRLDPTSWVAPERLTAMHWERTEGYSPSTWWNQFGFLATQMESQWKMWVTYYDADQQRELWRKMRNVDWTPFALGLLAFLAVGWIATGKRWYAVSPVPLHQWKWVLRSNNLVASTTTVAYKQHIPNDFTVAHRWLAHVEMALYADATTTIVDYGVWLKTLALMKSTSYNKSSNKFEKVPQTP